MQQTDKILIYTIEGANCPFCVDYYVRSPIASNLA